MAIYSLDCVTECPACHPRVMGWAPVRQPMDQVWVTDCPVGQHSVLKLVTKLSAQYAIIWSWDGSPSDQYVIIWPWDGSQCVILVSSDMSLRDE